MVGGAAAALGAAAGSRIGAGRAGITDDQARLLDKVTAAATSNASLSDVEHIVILMQENRSFDHYFGSLRGVRGFGDPHPVAQPSGQPVWNQSGVLPFRPALPAGSSDLGLVFIEDLAHGWQDTHQAWNNGNWDRWVPAKTSPTMAYLTDRKSAV